MTFAGFAEFSRGAFAPPLQSLDDVRPAASGADAGDGLRRECNNSLPGSGHVLSLVINRDGCERTLSRR